MHYLLDLTAQTCPRPCEKAQSDPMGVHYKLLAKQLQNEVPDWVPLQTRVEARRTQEYGPCTLTDPALPPGDLEPPLSTSVSSLRKWD